VLTLDDGRLGRLRDQVREWAPDFRALAMEVDRDPEAIRAHLDLPGVRFLTTMGVPRRYRAPEPIGGEIFDGTSASERVVVMEELACGDAGVLVAAPGPLLAGVLLQVLGDESQQDWFHQRMLKSPHWTCFALTEPARGSDAGFLETTLTRETTGDAVLTGAKRYVGNAVRAQLAVVFGRTGASPLGITAAMLDTSAPGFRATAIETIGLRGARLSAVTLDNVGVAAEHLLGRHLSPSRRGMWAFTRTFNLLRPSVAAIGLGIARGAYEYMLAHRRRVTNDERHDLDRIGRAIDGVRVLTQRAAQAVDAQPGDGQLASAAKFRAARLAEQVTQRATAFFGPGARLEHPLLDKAVRDARGMEFIEGTSHMQRLAVFNGTVAARRGPVSR
jgi:alkylation response protein AidB-like acyl-CoA dehydrogenase